MDLQTLEMKMEPVEAREKYIEYRDAVKERQDAELEQIARGYKALAQGQRLISLSDVIRRGGSVRRRGRWGGNPYVLPALACTRAHARECYVSIGTDGSIRFDMREYPSPNATRNVVRTRDGTLLVEEGDELRTTTRDFYAMVPVVPPALRPRTALSNYHILWEANWRIKKPAPPKDPALLRRIGGDLYAVVAVWDLTELERTVLAGRGERTE